MRVLQSHHLDLSLHAEMYCRKHIMEMCPSPRTLPQDSEKPTAEAIVLNISAEIAVC